MSGGMTRALGALASFASLASFAILPACGSQAPAYVHPAPAPAASAPAPSALPAPVPAPAPSAASAPDTASLVELKLGPITLTVSDARTAQVFHVVDRLSKSASASRAPSAAHGASSGVYGAYGAYGAYGEWAAASLPMDDAERAMLASHAKLRTRTGLGALDQAFYVALPIADAAQRAADRKLLLPADADAERLLLDHFAPRLETLLDAQSPALAAFQSELVDAAKRAAPLAAQLARFCETDGGIDVRAFVVADPSPVKGESAWRGGRLVAEVIPDYDNVPTFLHALFDAIFARRRGSFAVAAQKCHEPLDAETMQEGVAYAFAPGLVHPPGRDVLLEMVNEDVASSPRPRRALRTPQVRYERLGLALRTELESELEGGHDTLTTLLPKACDAWAKIARP